MNYIYMIIYAIHKVELKYCQLLIRNEPEDFHHIWLSRLEL